ncbi:IS30 family transposase [Actinocorallia populi]|uniref:IS30 family transposase n=1 Tax=Actinocorallia populi TaxID=2079200 RepID=UPI0018E52D8E|nr:IS30 family transposase [Actinocorallia populi]
MLTLEDREEISRGIAEGLENKQIAARIGRCASIVSREIDRHGGRAEYRASRAERAATTDRKRPKARKMDDDPYLRLVVVELLKQGWSPQQIAGRLPIDHPGEEAVRVSHEAVYAWIYALPKGELARQGLALRSGRTRRKPAHGRVAKAPRTAGMRWITERPADAADRQVPGHWEGGWEGGLIIGKDGKTAVGTLVERVSRFVVLVPLAARNAATVSEAVIDSVQDLPGTLRRSLTCDCGSEMADHAAITLKAELPVCFAHPHSPWERGTNENTNRWLREYFPKGTVITNDPDYLQAVADELNNRPRAILGYLKPKEVFAELLTSGIATTG